MSDWDIVFADDERESNPTSFKFLQMAHAWKAAQAKAGGGSTPTFSGFAVGAGAAPAKELKSQDDYEKGEDGSSDVASSNGDD